MVAETVFVGRERQLDQLDGYLARALAGEGQIAFISGEPGAGKTSLARQFARRAQDADPDLLIAVGECNAQTGEGDGYLPFKEVLRLLLGDVDAKLNGGAVTATGAARLKRGLLRVAEVCVEVAPMATILLGGIPGYVVAAAGQAVLQKKGALSYLNQLSEWQKKSDSEAAPLDQGQVLEQYTKLLTQLAASAPLVVFLDDLQWADSCSLNLLFHLARRIQGSRVLLLGAYRPGDVALGRGGERHPLVPILNELKRYYGNIEVRLDALTDQAEAQNEIASFVQSYIDRAYAPHELGPEFHSLIVGRTEGNPLFTVELLRHLEEEGTLVRNAAGVWRQVQPLSLEDLPARVEAVIEEWFLRMDEELRTALTTASVEGDEFTAQVVALVRHVEESLLVERLIADGEKRHQVVQEKGIARLGEQELYLFRFRHSLFQHHLYEGLTPLERTLIHRQVADALERLFENRTDQIAVQLAHHFLQARLPEKAYEYLTKAGDQARDSLALEDALAHYQRAHDLASDPPKRARALERLADIHMLWGDWDKSLELHREALGLAGAADKALEVRLYRKAALASWQRWDIAGAAELVERALAGVQEIADPLEQARVSLAAAHVALEQHDVVRSKRLAEEALSIAEPLDSTLEIAQAYEVLALAHVAMGDLPRGLEYLVKREEFFLDTLAMAQSFDTFLCGLAFETFGPRPHAETEQAARKLLEDAERIGGTRSPLLAHSFLGRVLFLRGRWNEAAEHLRLALEGLDQAKSAQRQGHACDVLAQMEVARGSLESARDYLRRLEVVAESPEAANHLNGELFADRARVWLSTGDVEAAQRVVTEALGGREEWKCPMCNNVAFLPVAVEVALAAGDLDRAGRLQAQLEQVAQMLGPGALQASALRSVGMLHFAQGRPREAIEALEESRALFIAKGQPYDLAHTLRDLARAYHERAEPGDRERAQAALIEAERTYQELGAPRDLQEARELAAQLS